MRASLLALIALALLACRATAPAPLTGGGRPFTFRVEGNSRLSDDELERALAFELDEYQAGGYAKAYADDAEFQALVHYRSSGFPFAEVRYEQLSRETPPGLVLHVTEGERVLVDESAFAVEGVREFTREEVLSLLDAPRTGLLGGGNLLFVPDAVAGLRAALEREYVARGYRETRVASPAVEFTKGRTRARITVTAEEGPRHLCGRVQLEERGVPRALRERVGELCATFPFQRKPRSDELLRDRDGRRVRRPMTPRVPFELRGEISDLLGDAAFPDAKVEVEVVPREPRTASSSVRLEDLVVRVERGARVAVGDVRVEGLDRTDTSLVLSRLRLEPGDPWSNAAMRTSVRRLYRSGLFRRVEVDRVPPKGAEGPKEQHDLVVSLEEIPTRELFLEPGYGSWELFRLRAGARERNLFGTGTQLRVEGTAAVRATRALVSLRDPWLFQSDQDLIGDLTFRFDERENPSFTERTTGAGAFVTKPWDDRESTTFGYQFRRSEALAVEVVDEVVEETLESVDISSVRVSHRRDLRDNPLLPSERYFFEAGLEVGDQAIGSELDFLRGTFSIAGYRRLGTRTVLATSFRTGLIQPLRDEESIPLQERFFNGGENTVRSFMEDQLGPKDDDGEPIGGEAFHVLNLEVRRPVGETRFEVAAFLDVGDLSESASDWTKISDPRYGVGIGLRYLLPIGPVRLDVGANPSPREEEEDYAVHFAIGIAF